MKKKISFPSSRKERIKLLMVGVAILVFGIYFARLLYASARRIEMPGFEKSKELLNSKEDIWNFQK